MGLIWRSIMPLLSTLAALVIIVHSAEEEMERGYRRDLHPRAVDPANYEQPWKAIDMEPLTPQSTRAEVWMESPEEVPPRRRPVRKRKRRPLPYPDSEPHERHQESIQAAYHPDFHDSQHEVEAPKRRRKRPDNINNYFTEGTVSERPLRRRGLRKKRPDYDEQLADIVAPIDFEVGEDITTEKRKETFDKYNNKHFYEDYDTIITERINTDNPKHINTEDPKRMKTEDPSGDLKFETDALEDRLQANYISNKQMLNHNRSYPYRFEEQNQQHNKVSESVSLVSSSEEHGDVNQKQIKEISTELPRRESIGNINKSNSDPDIMVMIHKPKEKGVIDPVMLKQLLKRSNGSSLSEMLQRHNLSLADLLQGRDEAISALNADASGEPQSQLHDDSFESTSQLNRAESKYPTRRQTASIEKHIPKEASSGEETKRSNNNENGDNVETITDKVVTEIENQESTPKMNTKRRFPTGIRRKLRMRPMLNSTLKAQLSRDLIALSARKYSHNNKNVTKSREWKDIVPLMPDRSKIDDDTNSKVEVTEAATSTTDAAIDTTIPTLEISNSSYSIVGGAGTNNEEDNEVENAIATTEATTTIIIEVLPAEMSSEVEKPKVTPIIRPSANNSSFRRQAYNNRLKRKRLKHKSSTTENPTDDLMKNFLGMADLVSASQFIERTQKPFTTIKEENTEFASELEDFMTTQSSEVKDKEVTFTQVTSTKFLNGSTTKSLPQESITSTEQSAKFEIEEILNDTMTSERLAKILRERNMTLSELVNHRERGSSHVHLADIFHNASKEPNPPEPFLTKSSIEPISKETYPLRAILEANTHETTTRSSTQGDQRNYMHIPVVMDFGNNVNENGESMGIMSLFNKLTDSEVAIDKAEIGKDSDGTPYVSSVIKVNTTNSNDTNRESRLLTDDEDWSELLSFMKAHNISTFEEDLKSFTKGDIGTESSADLDEDSLMLLDDMRHIINFENNIAPGLDENVEMNMFERRENLSEKPGILSKLPNNTKSVAIATASILGLAAILFLLTYIAFKWKQQRNKLRKKESFCDGPIPSPVFENRKSHKNNCSSRSISPMISNTNIYMSTLESNGKESPDYMWNSLRKPFQ